MKQKFILIEDSTGKIRLRGSVLLSPIHGDHNVSKLLYELVRNKTYRLLYRVYFCVRVSSNNGVKVVDNIILLLLLLMIYVIIYINITYKHYNNVRKIFSRLVKINFDTTR